MDDETETEPLHCTALHSCSTGSGLEGGSGETKSTQLRNFEKKRFYLRSRRFIPEFFYSDRRSEKITKWS